MFIFHHETYTKRLPCLIYDFKIYDLKILSIWSDVLGKAYVVISKGTNFQLGDKCKSWDIMYSVMIIVNNTVLYVQKLLRDLKSSHQKKSKFVTTCGDVW